MIEFITDSWSNKCLIWQWINDIYYKNIKYLRF